MSLYLRAHESTDKHHLPTVHRAARSLSLSVCLQLLDWNSIKTMATHLHDQLDLSLDELLVLVDPHHATVMNIDGSGLTGKDKRRVLPSAISAQCHMYTRLYRTYQGVEPTTRNTSRLLAEKKTKDTMISTHKLNN